MMGHNIYFYGEIRKHSRIIIHQVQSNLSQGVHQGKDKKWLLKTGNTSIQVDLHCFFGSRNPEKVAA